jgi:ribosomal protein S6--L-glutamate ligase
MRIAILSQNARLYSTRRLREACRDRGHKVDVLNTLQFSIHLAPEEPDLWYRNKPVKHYDAVVPRIGASITFFGTAVVRQFEQMGVFCLNSTRGIAASRDKLRAMQILSRHDIGIPATAFVRQRDAVMPAIQEVGGAPVIIKLLEGTQGVGVILADSSKIAEAILETFQSTKQNALIQKFVKESKGRDIRAFVVGGRVVAAMRRKAIGDEFRSNVHRGGSAKAVTLDPAYELAALRAAQILGLNVAGVDMLEGKEGPVIMEVNSSPGLEGVESATGVDVAGAVVEFAERQVLFPEIDVRQRLTLDQGYGVAEIPVHEESELKDKTIRETGLREHDITILSILRGGGSIANPCPDRQILAGDRLLCFGKTMAMSALLEPVRAKRSRRQRKRRGGAGR